MRLQHAMTRVSERRLGSMVASGPSAMRRIEDRERLAWRAFLDGCARAYGDSLPGLLPRLGGV